MDDSTDGEQERIYEEPKGWFGVTFLTWSVVLSCLLHSSFLIPSFLSFSSGEADIDVEWLKSFDSLEGLGHGASGRWADVDLAALGEKEPEEPIENVGPEVPPEPEPEPEPKPEPKPEPPRPKVKPRPNPEVKPPEVKPPEPPKPPSTPREVYSRGDLPGLDRTGPSGLPAMDGYGPGNAVFTALVRFDRVKGTEFEEPTRKLVSAVPDYRILLDGTGIDPVRDFHSMFMASANPVYIDETFLAVRHRATATTLRNQLDRRFDTPIPWRRQRNYSTRALVPPDSPYPDRRKILLPPGDLALVVRPEWVTQLTTALPDGSRLVEGVDTDALNRRPTMLDGLAHIERAAADADTIVLVSAMAVRVSIPGIGRLAFEGAKMQIANLDRPELTIDVALRSPDEATQFAARCPALKKKAIEEVPWVARSITRMVVERLTCEPAGNFVAISGTYTRKELHRVLNIATPWVPRPPILSKLPRPKNPVPPPKGPETPAPDAGIAAPSVDAGQANLPSEPSPVSPTSPEQHEDREDGGDQDEDQPEQP